MYLKETIVFSAAEAPDNISVLSWCHVKKNKDSEDGGYQVLHGLRVDQSQQQEGLKETGAEAKC